MPQLKSFRNKPGAVLEAFDEQYGEHLGTIVVVELPHVLEVVRKRDYPDTTPIVIIKRAIRLKHKAGRLPRGSVGLWDNCYVEPVE